MYEFGRKFHFIINKLENDTLHISQLIQNNSDNVTNDMGRNEASLATFSNNGNNSNISYDSSGAAKYIVVMVFFYGFIIIFFIGSQVRSTAKSDGDIDGINAEKILRSMEMEIFSKEVLG